ncbi:MAG: methyltransferase [Rhodanobacteraceae bacterium]
MNEQTNSPAAFKQLMKLRDAAIVHSALCAAAKLGVADLLAQGLSTPSELARSLNVNEDALYRTLRALATQGIFEESDGRRFRNSELSDRLRTGVPGSVRPAFMFWGTEFYYRAFGDMFRSIQTGEASKPDGMNEWEYMAQNPDVADIFDEAMTNFSTMQAPMLAGAYDFGKWESIMDVGGGNGILLSCILKTYKNLRGVLADRANVLERASQRGFLEGELASRTTMQECDFFREVPSGCRAYVMKNVIHDWDDAKARDILAHCRRAVPSNGVLLLVEWSLSEPNVPSIGKLSDLIMLVLTGGKERTVEEFRQLLSSAQFSLHGVTHTPTELSIFEAFPV